MTLIVSAQDAVAALQADNTALRSQVQSLQQRVAIIEALPGIRRRLDLVRQQ